VGSSIACTSYGRMLLDEPGRKEEGISYLKRASILEEVFGQTLLGHQLLYFGNTPELQAEGFAWTKAAAEAGHKPAMDKLATAYRTGKGCAEDAKLALYWMQKGASLGNSNCQTALGTAYMAGDLIEQDLEKAHNLYHLAHMQGDPWGTFVLGVSYENGHGVDKDLERAFALYMEAAKKKLIRAGYKVGMAYMWGEGVEEDIPAAAYWFKQAANGGDDDAQVRHDVHLWTRRRRERRQGIQLVAAVCGTRQPHRIARTWVFARKRKRRGAQHVRSHALDF
jgi:uncharacterized protein